MRIFNWFKGKLTIKEKTVKVANACPCGCSPNPFVYVFDGKVGVTVEFETEEELNEFKNQVLDLEMGKTQ